jgi:hypothetical protein
VGNTNNTNTTTITTTTTNNNNILGWTRLNLLVIGFNGELL